MELDEKYLKLLNLLIYDKRRKMHGIISGILISKCAGGFMISYQVFMSRIYVNTTLFLDDIEKGNVVFVLPFSLNRQDDLFEVMAEDHEKRIKEFFGDKFRDDMIIRISEEERQEEIRKWENLERGVQNWDNKCSN